MTGTYRALLKPQTMTSTATTANAACGNGGKAETGEKELKKRASCKMVKYCCHDCQRSHWPKHESDFKKRAAAELLNGELFKDPPKREECPICMLPLPLEPGQTNFQTCCGKLICCGCIHAQRKEDVKNGKYGKYIQGACPFCREPEPTTDEMIVMRLKNGMKKNIPGFFTCFARFYVEGDKGFPRDLVKGRALLLKAVELGCAKAYAKLAYSYIIDDNGEFDIKKARHYYELAAMGGDIPARYVLGCLDIQVGDLDRAYKHFEISAKAGLEDSLKPMLHGYKDGYITKDEYTEVFRSYQKKQEDMKSEMRDEYLVYKANRQLYWA